MPPKLLFDLAGIDMDRVLTDQDGIREFNAHAGRWNT